MKRVISLGVGVLVTAAVLLPVSGSACGGKEKASQASLEASPASDEKELVVLLERETANERLVPAAEMSSEEATRQ